jgi:hypothetical protein
MEQRALHLTSKRRSDDLAPALQSLRTIYAAL